MGITKSLLLAFLCTLALPSLAGPYSNMYVLGDSLSDSGNIFLATGGAIPPAPYDAGHFSNGAVAVEHVADRLGLSLAPSLAGGTNYAYGGARTDSHPFGSVPFDVISQKQQLLAAHPVLDPNALYVVFAGANNLQDIIRAVSADPANGSAILGAGITNAISDLAGVIGELAGHGAQHFLVPNAPDLAITPRIRELGSASASGLAHLASVTFNAALENIINTTLASLDIEYFDLLALANSLLADPAAMGFTNVTERCYTGDDSNFTGGGSVCANPDEYLFWDSIHPTARAHQIIGDALYASVAPEPTSLFLFAVALAAWTGASRRWRQSVH